MKNIRIISIILVLRFAINGLAGTEPVKPVDLPKICGISRYQVPLPFDNTTSGLGQFPWVAKVGDRDPDTNNLFFFCTGSLIHERFVIAAGHCGKQGKVVRVGELDFDREKDCDECDDCAPPFQESMVSKTYFANHCRLTKLNDISLIMLETSIVFNEYVQPICLMPAPIDHNAYIGKNVTVPGWGAPFSGEGKPLNKHFINVKMLMFIETHTVAADECNGQYPRNLDKSELCVTYPKGVVPNPCVIDSGSPLIEYRLEKELRVAYLAGVASRNLSCDANNLHPVIFTDVSAYALQLLDIMADSLNEKQK